VNQYDLQTLYLIELLRCFYDFDVTDKVCGPVCE
jgi:hypothetical protein